MYLLIYPEGSIVDIDSNSVFSLTETFPDCVIYTELGGSVQTRGVIKLLSDIKMSWIQPMLNKLKEVDVFKLAGITFEDDREKKRKPLVQANDQEMEE